MLKSLKAVDLYRKAMTEYHQPTAFGGILSLVCYSFALILLCSETLSYLSPPVKWNLLVEPHSDEDYMIVSVNISFASLPCNSLVAYFTDQASDHYIFYSLNRSVLDSAGRIVASIDTSTIQEPDTCGSCYGAERHPNQCCRTCAEVMETYGDRKWKPPQFSEIEQCKIYISIDSSQGPGCQLSGDMRVKKIPGSMHFRNTLDTDKKFFEKHNGGHTVNKFAFKDPKSMAVDVPGPVDGKVVYGHYSTNYYLKIMPAVKKEGRFYESSANFLMFHHPMNPEILFTYDLEPISTVFVEGKKFNEFLVSVCAIIGGWYAITLLLAKIVIK